MTRLRVLGAIIAGGQSRRMGQDKALIPFNGKPLIAHVGERLAPQVEDVVINANDTPARFDFLGWPVIADVRETGTPLAGLHAALRHAAATGFDAILTAPCDTPFLPADLRQRLEEQGTAIASSAGQDHFLTGFWPVGLLPQLEEGLTQGLFRVKDWAALAGAKRVSWAQPTQGPDPFLNLNRPEDLAPLSEKW